MSELYLFEEAGVKRGYTPTVFSTSFDSVTYIPTAVSRSSITITDQFSKATVSFKFARSHPYAKSLLADIPETPIKVVVYRNSLVYWEGKVTRAKASGMSIEVQCENTYSTLARAGISAKMTLNCRHTLYGVNCKVLQALHGEIYHVNATSSVIAIAGLAEGRYNNGIASIPGQTRRIVLNTTSDITLVSPFTGSYLGDITIYKGCKLTEADCMNTFNNLDNFGGFARIPTKDPFAAQGLL